MDGVHDDGAGEDALGQVMDALLAGGVGRDRHGIGITGRRSGLRQRRQLRRRRG